MPLSGFPLIGSASKSRERNSLEFHEDCTTPAQWEPFVWQTRWNETPSDGLVLPVLTFSCLFLHANRKREEGKFPSNGWKTRRDELTSCCCRSATSPLSTSKCISARNLCRLSRGMIQDTITLHPRSFLRLIPFWISLFSRKLPALLVISDGRKLQERDKASNQFRKRRTTKI